MFNTWDKVCPLGAFKSLLSINSANRYDDLNVNKRAMAVKACNTRKQLYYKMVSRTRVGATHRSSVVLGSIDALGLSYGDPLNKAAKIVLEFHRGFSSPLCRKVHFRNLIEPVPMV